MNYTKSKMSTKGGATASIRTKSDMQRGPQGVSKIPTKRTVAPNQKVATSRPASRRRKPMMTNTNG